LARKVYHKKQSILFVETILPILGGVLGTKPETIFDAAGRQPSVNYALAAISGASLSGRMDLRFDLAAALDRALSDAAPQAGLIEAGFAPEVRPADPVHGDFQANGVLAYAKRHRQNPRVLADALARQLGELTPLFDIAIAGPGFINFKLKPATFLA